ncbi:cyclin-dependent kinase 11A isoform X1 [Amblyraja radiata]|uniref:cyclin-dependent kinase 11A isoform X1 n=2 Tax=Amblyraja radiata TaxID=386614 RepID=UPI001402FE3D|nr:cyclin-dependent kinase 11A isoform X1 [Amblyraja radiata]XP_032903793.1 cyclin-dependent kinase 11A isoform X1 [Amblyraja radiata]XP_032903794.1 cyclin-dependent kinase 11A isoform X1 [Amblyraja radiata]XP_032903795.1 cyclin-dependent kinase 11A isoform X1 [Amblyraja radiata]XP_032903796.1 cyclin-dependent kinase 11A isoform X1 [Amblyraja radiata]XP_032903797.1 cyclin-dependent kinase 11A isoform X1 [Amblyraja radiata]XP_032903798.1 cyclin-dependent kinase 11A isoform X1 [Amblyraja radiat
MGDEKDNWKVKTLEEILQEKKRRKEQEEKVDVKRLKNLDDRDSKRDSPEEGELQEHKMEITIRNSPHRREGSIEDRGEEDDSLAIKPPQQTSKKEKSHHRKEERRKEKRRHRSRSAEGKHMRGKEKDKEKEREHERRKRQREEQDKARRERERQKRRELAREHSRRESAYESSRDRLEQLERQRERERRMREREQLQKDQWELKERERRAEERRKERDIRREAMMHHRGLNDEYAVKVKIHHRSHSPVWRHAERFELDERKNVKEERYEEKDPPSDLQDISESEIKTTSGESTSGSATASEAESSSEGSEESLSPSEVETEPSPGEISEEEEHSDEERQNGNHLQMVTESKFDHDSEESVEEEDEEEMEEEDDEEEEEESPISNAPTEEEYVPDSPPASPVEPKKELPQYLPALQGCRSVEEFQCLNRIEEGTYGVVYRAKDKKTDEIVALKRLKMEKEKEGFPITSLREINTILKAQHPNIVTVREIVVGSNMDKIYIVMNYVEHDLKSLMETMKQPFLPGEVKTLMLQLLKGVRHLHDNWILHRDLKTSNLLLSHSGILKIGDFGLAREYGSPLKPYTPVVVTLWYRTPELLLGAKEYSTAIDLWSVGCIFAEFLTQKPLFPGKSEIDQINKIFKELGTPSEKIWPGYNDLPAVKKMTFTEYPFNNLRKRFGALLSDQGFDLMNKFLTYCPAKRITAEEALKHDYFRETPLPIESAMFPTWPAKSEQQRVKRGTSPRPPEGGLGYSQLGDDDLKDTGFHLTTTNQGASAAGPGFSLKF